MVKLKPGREKQIGEAVNKQVVLDKGRLNDILALYPNKSMSQILRDLIEQELERTEKKDMGLVNPIKVSYEAPNKVMSLLHYLQETIDSEEIRIECSKIKDHKTLTRLKGMAYTINKSADQQSMVLYREGIKT